MPCAAGTDRRHLAEYGSCRFLRAFPPSTPWPAASRSTRWCRPKSRRTLEIGVDHLKQAPADEAGASDVVPFADALVRVKKSMGLYQADVANITLDNRPLFSGRVHFPANVPTGNYEVTVMLFNGGEMVTGNSAVLQVSKGGADAWIYDARMIRRPPTVYARSLGRCSWVGPLIWYSGRSDGRDPHDRKARRFHRASGGSAAIVGASLPGRRRRVARTQGRAPLCLRPRQEDRRTRGAALRDRSGRFSAMVGGRRADARGGAPGRPSRPCRRSPATCRSSRPPCRSSTCARARVATNS